MTKQASKGIYEFLSRGTKPTYKPMNLGMFKKVMEIFFKDAPQKYKNKTLRS